MSGHCDPRSDEFSVKLDELDRQIAELVRARDELVSKMPRAYDSCGEGEVYWDKLPFDRAEAIYHLVAKI